MSLIEKRTGSDQQFCHRSCFTDSRHGATSQSLGRAFHAPKVLARGNVRDSRLDSGVFLDCFKDVAERNQAEFAQQHPDRLASPVNKPPKSRDVQRRLQP